MKIKNILSHKLALIIFLILILSGSIFAGMKIMSSSKNSFATTVTISGNSNELYNTTYEFTHPQYGSSFSAYARDPSGGIERLRTSDGKVVFCLDPASIVNGSALYTDKLLSGGTLADSNASHYSPIAINSIMASNIRKIIYWGYVKNSQTVADYAVIQILVWKAMGWDVSSATNFKHEVINNLFNQYTAMPDVISFSGGNNISFNPGETKIISTTDPRMSTLLDDLDYSGINNGWSISNIGGGRLSITAPNVASQNRINLTTKSNLSGSRVWIANMHSQAAVSIDSLYGTTLNLSVNVPNDIIREYRIKKTDTAGLSLSGAEFEVAEDREFSRILTTLRSNTDGYTNNGTWTFRYNQPSSKKLYIRESLAPNGYVKDASIKEIDISVNTVGVKEETFVNKKEDKKIKFKKIDPENNHVSGVVFEVEWDGIDTPKRLTSDSQGYFEVSGIPGDVERISIREISSPSYVRIKNDPESINISSIPACNPASDSCHFDINGALKIRNEFNDMTLKIIKKDASGGFVSGVVFEYSDSQDFSHPQELVTSNDGSIQKNISTQVRNKTIYVREKSAPAHLIKSNEVKTVTLRAGETSSVEFVNQFKGARAKIVKKDASNRAIQAVRFEIATNPQFTNSETLTTGANGEISKSFQITTVTPPTIYVREVSAPSYLVVDNRVQSKPLVIDGTVDFEFVNQFNQAPITIRKTDEKGKNIASVVFELSETRDFARIFDTVTTNAQGLVNKTYPTTQPTKVLYIREKSVPSHLVLSKEIKEITLAPNTTPTVTFVNDFVERDVELSKSDLSSADPIKGVTLTIYDASDENNRTKIYENITNKDGKLPGLKLKPGKYKFIETHAIIGYKINPNPHFFEVLEDGTILGSTVMTDEREEYEFEIDKVDNKGNKVRGVVFEAKNKLTGEILTATTDENGVAKFKGIWADYEIKEKSAPEGYIKDENTYVLQLKKDGTYERMKVVNNKVEAPNTGAENGGILPILVSVGSILFAGTAFLIKRRA